MLTLCHCLAKKQHVKFLASRPAANLLLFFTVSFFLWWISGFDAVRAVWGGQPTCQHRVALDPFSTLVLGPSCFPRFSSSLAWLGHAGAARPPCPSGDGKWFEAFPLTAWPCVVRLHASHTLAILWHGPDTLGPRVLLSRAKNC